MLKNCFSDLEGWQSEMAAAIRLGEDPGYAIYHRTQRYNRLDALKQIFPALEKIMGEQAATGMLLAYCDANPAQQANLMNQGSDLPAWVTTLPELGEFGWLADLVRWDLAMHHAWLADDINPAGWLRPDLQWIDSAWDLRGWQDQASLTQLPTHGYWVLARQGDNITAEPVEQLHHASLGRLQPLTMDQVPEPEDQINLAYFAGKRWLSAAAINQVSAFL
ncbi:MAG: DUF2063 domain-containing protein [Pseudomonadales bacterium]|nr:DUF2063 domain-containing protein [Pseudomonadales bacterium]